MRPVKNTLGPLALLGLVASACGGATAIPLAFSAGSTSGTLHVTNLNRAGGKPVLTGDIGGRTLTGSLIGEPTLSQGKVTSPDFTYTGTLGGHAYRIVLAIQTQENPSTAATLFVPFDFVVSGTYGSETVSATARFGRATFSGTTSSLPVPFSGHVGTQTIKGTATASEGVPNRSMTVKVAFTIS